jgi:hypothetical protein
VDSILIAFMDSASPVCSRRMVSAGYPNGDGLSLQHAILYAAFFVENYAIIGRSVGCRPRCEHVLALRTTSLEHWPDERNTPSTACSLDQDTIAGAVPAKMGAGCHALPALGYVGA